MFFQKTIYKLKIIDLKKIRLYEVTIKVAAFVRKSFYSKILKWQKVSYQEKKNEKVQICQNAPTPLKCVMTCHILLGISVSASKRNQLIRTEIHSLKQNYHKIIKHVKS